MSANTSWHSRTTPKTLALWITKVTVISPITGGYVRLPHLSPEFVEVHVAPRTSWGSISMMAGTISSSYPTRNLQNFPKVLVDWAFFMASMSAPPSESFTGLSNLLYFNSLYWSLHQLWERIHGMLSSRGSNSAWFPKDGAAVGQLPFLPRLLSFLISFIFIFLGPINLEKCILVIFFVQSLLRYFSLPLTYLVLLKEGFRALAPTAEVTFKIEAMSRVGYFFFSKLSVNNKNKG